MKRTATAFAAMAVLVGAAPAVAAPIQGYDDNATELQANAYPAAAMNAHGASVMRVIVPAYRAGQGLEAIRQASAAGKRIYLSLDGGTADPQAQAAFFRQWLPVYQAAAPLWAVSIQNEPEIGGPGYYPAESPAQYRAVWDTVEPVVHQLNPGIIAVFADAWPDGENFIKSAWTTHPPANVGAIAYHAYASHDGLNRMPEFSAWAATQHTPLWASEYTDWADPPGDFARALALSPNVQLVSYYEWSVSGFTPEPFDRTFGARPIPVTNTTPATTVLPHPTIGAASIVLKPVARQAAKKPHAKVKHIKHRRLLKRFQPAPDPPPSAKHAYLCPGYYTRVRDIMDIYHWNGTRYMLVREQRGKPYLIFHQTGKCKKVK